MEIECDTCLSKFFIELHILSATEGLADCPYCGDFKQVNLWPILEEFHVEIDNEEIN